MTLPKGYGISTTSAGFRNPMRHDVGLIVSDRPAAAAAVFTTNAFPAAPVLACREVLAGGGPVRGVLVNSGQANACTGDEGLRNCWAVLDMAARAVGIPAGEMLPMSTGVIGEHLRMELWEKAMPALAAGLGSGTAESFARAMMTTDAFPKFLEREVRLSGGVARLSAMAKGAGMICPNMATMLSVALCDAEVEPEAWREMFRAAADRTFNRVTVDGDTSTNDTALGLTNGASGVVARGEDLKALAAALEDVLGSLAYMLVRDGEGAAKVMDIRVRGAVDDADAEKTARTVGHSQLVKTAMYGRDANWGRIVAAVGRSGARFAPEDVRVALCGVELFRDGRPVPGDHDAALREPLAGTDVLVEITLGAGPGEYRLLASDLSHDYVTCNAEYRT